MDLKGNEMNDWIFILRELLLLELNLFNKN